MWTYVQRTGKLYHSDAWFADCYSGRGAGRNNPALENVKNTGPIPADTYKIGRAFTHPHAGVKTLRLTPVDGQAGDEDSDRAGFLIHGDSARGDASLGCIVPFSSQPDGVSGYTKRCQIDHFVWMGDDQLEVVAEERMRA